MSKYSTWKKTTSDHFSIDDLEFVAELKAEAVSGGSIAGIWNYLTGTFDEVDPVGALIDSYPTNPLSYPYGFGLSPEAENIYSGLQGIFTYLPGI